MQDEDLKKCGIYHIILIPRFLFLLANNGENGKLKLKILFDKLCV